MGIDPPRWCTRCRTTTSSRYELVHFSTRHRDDLVHASAVRRSRGASSPRSVRQTSAPAADRRARRTTGRSPPTASPARRDGDRRRRSASATCDDTSRETTRSSASHLLLAMFNALQPGVFALSGWDLCGMLTVAADEVADLIADGDTRWINRARTTCAAWTRGDESRPGRHAAGRSLYGTLPEQLADETSFLRRLQAILGSARTTGSPPPAGRRAGGLPPRELVMVHQLDERRQMTVLNFSGEQIAGTVRSEHLPPGARCRHVHRQAPSAPSTTCTASASTYSRTRECPCSSSSPRTTDQLPGGRPGPGEVTTFPVSPPAVGWPSSPPTIRSARNHG